MINLENVAYGYGGGKLLNNITLKSRPGSFHSPIGPSGSGNTTLMKLCYGALTPTSGQVMLFDENAREMSRDDVAHIRRRIGVVHQDCQLPGPLPASENIALPLTALAGFTAPRATAHKILKDTP